jgi:hypothetical protein
MVFSDNMLILARASLGFASIKRTLHFIDDSPGGIIGSHSADDRAADH